ATRDSPFTTVYDAKEQARAILVRSAYAEVEENVGAGQLFFRAGRQFRMGPEMAHFDGATAAWETHAIETSAFVGGRVTLYGDERSGTLSGGAVRGAARLGGWRLAGAGETVAFGDDLITSVQLRLERDASGGQAGVRLLDADVSEVFGLLRVAVSSR